MRRAKRIMSVVVSAILVVLMMVGCEIVPVEKIGSKAYISNTEIKGDSKNCAVVLSAQQGTSYTIAVESAEDWAHFSNGATYIEGTMETGDKVVYIYFDKNPSGQSRDAVVVVEFSDEEVFELEFTQHSYDSTIAIDREWAELPLCKNEDNYIYNTHYGRMGSKSNARNYTFCFDPDYRASVWVAYPLHSSYTTGSGNRDYSSFGYDPTVSTSCQANMGAGSYNGRYDRGHQIPAADRKCSQEMMDQTFYATNMTPQQANFNQKKWGALEGKVRNMICSDTLYVVTGAYFEGEHHSSIYKQTNDRSGNVCPTPTYYYKALLRTKKGNTGKRIDQISDASQLRAIAFWMEHADTGNDTNIKATDCISVAELEEITGFTFFPMLDDAIEAEVKRTAVASEWGITQ
ncbi:MAG: DNA/RNA non-specific endonuclease [Alistipes sp.]|nr:DNA/RNA non-specific endonuclease [Alistipes sp.]